MKFYHYEKCSTCRKARKWLDSKEIKYTALAIREFPPPESDMSAMLSSHQGCLRKLFNTSGIDYRELKIKNILNDLTAEDAFILLANNGNLIKRPFLIGKGLCLQGFNPLQWERAFNELER